MMWKDKKRFLDVCPFCTILTTVVGNLACTIERAWVKAVKAVGASKAIIEALESLEALKVLKAVKPVKAVKAVKAVNPVRAVKGVKAVRALLKLLHHFEKKRFLDVSPFCTILTTVVGYLACTIERAWVR